MGRYRVNSPRDREQEEGPLFTVSEVEFLTQWQGPVTVVEGWERRENDQEGRRWWKVMWLSSDKEKNETLLFFSCFSLCFFLACRRFLWSVVAVQVVVVVWFRDEEKTTWRGRDTRGLALLLLVCLLYLCRPLFVFVTLLPRV